MKKAANSEGADGRGKSMKMDHRIIRECDFYKYFIPEYADGIDDSFLELLCEDGFLDSSELAGPDFPGQRLLLLACAIFRGFWVVYKDENSLSALAGLVVKRSDSIRIWKDPVKDGIDLRAPPQWA